MASLSDLPRSASSVLVPALRGASDAAIFAFISAFQEDFLVPALSAKSYASKIGKLGGLLSRKFLTLVREEKIMDKKDCECEYFFVADIACEGKRVRLHPQSLDSLREHVGSDRAMAMGLLLEVARTLGQLGFVASREGVSQKELRVEDPMTVLSGDQALPWRLEIDGKESSGLLRTMFCCEGHGNPYYCTAPR